MTGISDITKALKNAFSSIRTPATIISTVILLCAIGKRPGLSCMISTSNVIQDIAKKGCPTGQLPDGSPNLMNEVLSSVICEVFRALKEEANIQIAIPPGSVNVNVSGGNAGGPFVAVGTNITPAKGVGLLQ